MSVMKATSFPYTVLVVCICFTYFQLTEEELVKQKDRKEQNRKAAMRCREKKKMKIQTIQEVSQTQIIYTGIQTTVHSHYSSVWVEVLI